MRSQIDAFDRQIFKIISERFQIVEAVARYKEKFGIPTIQQDRMLKLRKELKSDFSTSVDITDYMIDGIMTILMQAAIDKENRQLNR